MMPPTFCSLLFDARHDDAVSRGWMLTLLLLLP